MGMTVAAELPEEREVDQTGHVGTGEGGTDESHDEHEVVRAVRLTRANTESTGADENLVLRPEPGGWEHSGERDRANHERLVRGRHVLFEPAHVLLHVEAVDGVGDRARAEEQTGLEAVSYTHLTLPTNREV